MERARQSQLRSLADRIGMASSAICALHCVAAPSLLVTGTVLPASLATDETLHRMLLWVILPSALVAFGLGCWHHKDRGVLLLGVLGGSGLAASAAAPHDLLGVIGERVLALASAGLLIAAHIRNFRRCRAVACAHSIPAAGP